MRTAGGRQTVTGEFTRAVAQRQTINPRTVLGFYATIILILLTASISMVTVLATTKTATEFIPWIISFTALGVLAIIGGVFYINIRRPANLMLGQITGTEYAEIHKQVILGNSSNGERLATTTGSSESTVDPDAITIDETVVEPKEIMASKKDRGSTENG
jgi:hypothetical protein